MKTVDLVSTQPRQGRRIIAQHFQRWVSAKNDHSPARDDACWEARMRFRPCRRHARSEAERRRKRLFPQPLQMPHESFSHARSSSRTGEYIFQTSSLQVSPKNRERLTNHTFSDTVQLWHAGLAQLPLIRQPI